MRSENREPEPEPGLGHGHTKKRQDSLVRGELPLPPSRHDHLKECRVVGEDNGRLRTRRARGAGGQEEEENAGRREKWKRKAEMGHRTLNIDDRAKSQIWKTPPP